MAATFNGIGTSFCFARGSGVRGGDALECFVILFMPIFPIKAVHLYGETTQIFGSNFRAIPLRWSPSLVVRVFLLHWMLFPLLIGSGMALLCTVRWVGEGSLDEFAPFLVVGWATTLTCGLGYFAL